LLFACAYFAGQSLGRDRDALVVARAAACAGIALGVYTLAEVLGFAPVDVEFASGRAGGPFGQPAFLGAASALLLPVAAGLALDRAQTGRTRVLGLAGAAGGAMALFAAEARAAWVGVAVAGLVALPRMLRAGGRRRSVLILAAIAVVGLAVAASLGGRVASTFDASDGGMRSRVDEWQVATRVLGDRPLAGVGPEGYRIAFGTEVDRDYERRYGRSVLPDRAHNGLLDVGVAGGIPALALAALLLGFVVVAAVRAVRAGPVWLAGFGAGVLAYAAQQQFLFPLAEVDPVFWACAGLLIARTSAPYAQWRVRVARALVVPVVAAVLLLMFFGAREIAADHDLEAARRAADRGDARAALAAADQATRLRPDSIRAWYVAAEVARAGGTIRDVDAALDRIEAGLDRSPRDPALATARADLLLDRAGRSGLLVDIERAIADLEGLSRRDPNHAGHHLQLGVAYALAGRDADAAEEFEVAADLAPGSDAPRQNLERLNGRTGLEATP
jgi:O-antigen ligase